MAFKKQGEGKLEQISDYSLSKSLASKLQMPCEWFGMSICLFLWVSALAKQPPGVSVWTCCSLELLCRVTHWGSAKLLLSDCILLEGHLCNSKYSTEVSRELEAVLLFLMLLIYLCLLLKRSHFYICLTGFVECVAFYSIKCIYLARNNGMLVTHITAI